MNNDLTEYSRLAKFLKKSLGNLYEVFVLEYTDRELKTVDGNCDGEEGIEKCFPLILDGIESDKHSIVNQAVEIDSGKLSKVSAQMIYDGSGKIIGAICIMLKCSPFLKLSGLANEFLNFESPNEENSQNYPLTVEGIEKYIMDFGFQSSKPTKYEKTEIILDLYDMGMFNIRGAVAKVADMLHISTKSVYRYISKIKEVRE